MARKSKKDYEQLGRMMSDIAHMDGTDRKRIYRLSFMKGVYGGLGGVVGATIVVALVILILSFLGEVPFVGKIAETVQNTLESR